VPDIQVRQADIQNVYFVDEYRQAGNNFFFFLLPKAGPVLPDEIGQALGLKLFGDEEGSVLDAASYFFAEAYRPVRFDAVVEKQRGVLPFVPGLRARPADVAKTEQHVFEMRMGKTLHEKPFFLWIRAKAERDNVAFIIHLDCSYWKFFEKIVE
jgi:hypothetical protein